MKRECDGSVARAGLRELNRTKLCERKRRRGERDQAEEEKRARASEARACSLVAYRAARLRLKVRLQVQGRVEIAAGVADAAALDCVHAHRDTAVVVRGDGGRRVREATLGLGALARAALELPAHLPHHTPAMSAARAPTRARARSYTRLLRADTVIVTSDANFTWYLAKVSITFIRVLRISFINLDSRESLLRNTKLNIFGIT